MCSPSGFIFLNLIIASLLLNCLHFGVAVGFGGDTTKPSPKVHIDITRKHSVHLNGVEIDESAVVDHLEDHEREFIFGKAKKDRAVKLVHLRYQTDGLAAATSATANNAPAHASRRVKRAADNEVAAQTNGARGSQEVSVQIQDSEHLVNLKLRQTPKLIDDAFIFIRRNANSTEFIEDSQKLAQKYERCFYSNENAALDLCDDENVRGVYYHNSTDFIIHPLPKRFGNSAHVIMEANRNSIATPPLQATPALDANAQFEPDEDNFEAFNVKHLAASRSGNYSNFENTNGAQKQNNYHHNDRNHESQHNIHLNLRYRPRYHHEDHYQRHQYQHQHQHRKQHQQQHQDQQALKHDRQQHQGKHHHTKSDQGHINKRRRRRYVSSGGYRKIPPMLHIETAIFVDRDLFKHMTKYFPKDTKDQLIRFVLAMINGVQLLYHHHSLGRRVNFILKRLEILYDDPADLRRSEDIDVYLSNFCMWQKSWNPSSDNDVMHYDHAVILTGLDLYVVAKNGKTISQVVGLAPVKGMCTSTSSCTINEGKHFESVFVVAHEIGHNLGMRHDTSENNCDPSLYIMSPTLGSGKITWSKCSRDSLEDFLRTEQAECLFDRGQFYNNLDHSAEGLLPGERFDADQQCMLKYGRDSVRAEGQVISDICRDLHCQRERYTWTSHPALEGTVCGTHMWCRSGRCVGRPTHAEVHSSPKLVSNYAKSGYDKANFLESSKMGQLLHEYNYSKLQSWGKWSDSSECDSGCLYGPSKRLGEGSTGLRTYTRSCLDFRRRCLGRDRKYESCIAQQCFNVSIMTIDDFATQVCEKAQKFDPELTGRGEQIMGDIEESCKVFCRTKSNATKSRSWTFPDGTTCRSKRYSADDSAYCIAGRCEKFSCDNSTNNYYKISSVYCESRAAQPIAPIDYETRRSTNYNHHQQEYKRYADNDNAYYNRVGGIYGPTTVRNKYENEVAVRNGYGQHYDTPYKRKSDHHQTWSKYNYHLNDQAPVPPLSASLVAASIESEWIVKSGCHTSCMAKSKGVQVVTSRRTGSNNIQLCTHSVKPCDRLLTPTEYAENTCARYKLKVRGLSGHGSQIAASIDEPDRSCRVGCQDEFIKYRFYLVNGKYGHFPLGTKCSHTEERYCVNGKCLEFGTDNIPLQQSHISLALFRSRRATADPPRRRQKRSYLYYQPVNITETITQDFINNIVSSIINAKEPLAAEELSSDDHIEFTNPIHISIHELSMK